VPSIDYDPSRAALFTPALRPALFEAGQAYSPVQLGLEFARLAYLRAEAVPEDETRLKEALARVGFGQPTSFWNNDKDSPETGSQGFAAYRPQDRLAVLAFRGTETQEWADLAHDLAATSVPWPEARGHVHDGFARSLRSLLPQVRDWLGSQGKERVKLLICGHSLGAAMATLAASIFQPATLVAVGSPRVGDKEFATCFAGVDVIRLVDCCDLVTHLPPETPWYTHVGPMTYIDRDGLVKAPGALSTAKDQWRARASYLVDHAWRKGTVEIRDLADHAPINYIRAYF